MKKSAVALILCAAVSTSLQAQDWSFGAGAGAFVFGTFVKRTLHTQTELGTGTQTTRLSAQTRAGVSADIERSFADRWAVRLEGTFTHAPLAVKASGGTNTINVGEMNVGTAMVPIVFRINPRGTFRFHILGGPAYAEYHVNPASGSSNLRPFSGNRGRFGFAVGGGVDWMLGRQFAIEGQITDISTSSPFERSDFPTTSFVTIDIPRTQNVHTEVGIRYRF